MTAFTIFVLLLTFGYLVYFAVMITLELHKKEEVQKSDEEVLYVLVTVLNHKSNKISSGSLSEEFLNSIQ